MAGLPKSYFKRFPGNMKAAWKAFKKERGTAKAPRKQKRSRKRAAPKSRNKEGGAIMAKRKGRKRAAVRKVARRARRRIGAAMATKPGKLIVGAGIATAGGVASSFALNNIPKVKDMSAGTKVLAQLGIGLAAIMFGRKPWIKALGGGAVVAGAFGASKTFLNLNPLAGPGAGVSTLPPDVMRQLMRGRLGRPVGAVGMGRPVGQVAMRGRVPTMGGGSSYGGVAIG